MCFFICFPLCWIVLKHYQHVNDSPSLSSVVPRRVLTAYFLVFRTVLLWLQPCGNFLASMEFSVIDYRPSDLVRLDVKINYETAPPLACICHRDKAQTLGRKLCAALKEYIPRQMFKIPIQACVGVKVLASESISPMRKDVLAKCYGGDITRKKKLLQKQAKGKKRMKAIGRVNVPQEAFTAVLRLNDPKGY